MGPVESIIPKGYKMTELGPLPEEWRVVRLGNLCNVVRGSSPRPKGDPRFFSKQPTGVHWIKISDLTKYKKGLYITTTEEFLTEEGKKRSRFLKRGTFVVTNSGTVGVPAFLGIDGCIHDGYLAFLNIDHSNLDEFFLYYWIASIKAFLEKIAPRGTQANLNTTIAKSLLIPLPPLPEQRAIAYVLRVVQRAKEATEGVILALRELKKSLMHHLFTYGPVPVGAAERVEMQETEVGLIPAHWRVVRLGDIAIVKSGGSAPQGEIYFLGGKHPFVRVQHLDVDTDHVKHWDLITDEAVQRYRLQKFPAGTIIFPKSGASIRLEKRAMLPVASYIVSHLCAVLPKIDAIERLFLFYSLKAKRLSKDKTDGYPVLNLSEIREVPIPLPPLPEQREIARILQAVDRKIEAEERRKQALEMLFKTLLHDLMTARRRLPKEFVAQFGKGAEGAR